jgi:uncharacterized repeat protein (TIGR01451 family)
MMMTVARSVRLDSDGGCPTGCRLGATKDDMTTARLTPAHRRRPHPWGTAVRLLLSLLIGVTAIGLGAASASATAALSVKIIRKTTIPAASGADIVYQLSVECTAVNDASCVDLKATIPLPQEIEAATVAGHPYIQSASFVRGTGIDITFVDPFPAGTTLSVPITMHTQNGTTPDGFHWDVPVTATADNADAATDTADGSVNASVNLTVHKTVSPATVLLDEPARYTIGVCDPTNPTGLGRLSLRTGKLVDQLPAGATFVRASSGGDYDAQTNTVTWSVDGYDPTFCNSVRFWIDATYDSTKFGTTAPLITTVTNTATVTATPYGATTPITTSDSVSHQFTDFVAPSGAFSKRSQTPFGVESTANKPYTYPGQWLGDSDPEFEATWNLSAASVGRGPIELRIDDRLPCSYGTGARSPHTSPLPGEPVCTAPTFVTEAVDVMFAGNPAGSFYRLAIENGWAPTWVSTSGAHGSFTLRSTDSDHARFVPAGLPGNDKVAEVVVPEDPSILIPSSTGLSTIARLQGHMIDNDPVGTYVDASNGAAVVNTARFQAYSNAQPLNGGAVDSQINVWLDRVRASLIKSMNSDGHVTLGVQNYGLTPLAGPVLTDLLPPGVTFGGVVPNGVSLNQQLGGVGDVSVLNATSEPNYGGSGRELVRITLRPGWSVAGRGPGTLNGFWTVTFATHGLSTDELPPGTTSNTAQLHVSGNDLSGCADQAGNFQRPSTADPLDLDHDGVTDDRFCAASATVTAPADGVALVSRKLVKGDLDAAFTGFPSVGAAAAGGGGQFRIELTNRSRTALNNAWVYDLLPRVGDTGVRQTTSARGSQFDASLQAVPVVTAPGATPLVEYSTAAVPCRGEVRSLPHGTWPNGCSDAWTATPPTPLSQVTAIRVSHLGDLPGLSTTPNVTITYPVSVPSSAVAGDVAWNSFAVTADRVDTGDPMLPTEPPKVGLAVPKTDVELTKDFGLPGAQTGSVAPGSVVSYRITVRHGTSVSVDANGVVTYTNPAGSAPSTARNVVVTDTLPSGLTIVPGSSTTLCGVTNPGGTFDEGTGVWRVGDVKPGDSYSLCFKAKLDDHAPGTLTNRAEVSATDGPEDIDSTPGNVGTKPHEDDDDHAVLTVLQPAIHLEKQVETAFNSGVWVDADQGTAERPVYPQGSPVRYRFVVQNTGLFPLTNVTVSDPQLAAYCPGLTPTFTLGLGETKTLTCTRDVGYAAGDHVNVATTSGQPSPSGKPVGPPVTDTDTAQVEVHIPLVSLVKYTNGIDADAAADAVPLRVGDDVTWKYVVTNIGTEPLTGITLSDDQEGAITIDPASCQRSDGAAVSDPLPVHATLTCTATGPATTVGLYTNVGQVHGNGALTGRPVTSSNPSHYVTQAPQPKVTLVKSTVTDHTGPAGADADQADQAPYATPGSAVSWIYDIVNSGNTDLVLTGLGDDIEGTVDLASCTRTDGLTMSDPLPPQHTAVCRLAGVAKTGLYGNVGTVHADVVDGRGHPTGATVSDENPSHYVGGSAKLAVVKSVCGFTTSAKCDSTDDSVWFQRHVLPTASKPIWLIQVTNVGDTAVDHALVTDDVAPGCARDLGLLAAGQKVRFACASTTKLTRDTTNVVSVVGTPVDGNGHPITDSTGHPTTTQRVTDDASARPPHRSGGLTTTPQNRPPAQRPSPSPEPPQQSSDSSGSGGWLPFTGASGVGELLAAGTVAIALGLGVMLWGRRRRT